MVTETWKVAVNRREHNTAAWLIPQRPVTYTVRMTTKQQYRDIKFCYLVILFWAIPHSLCGPNQCPFLLSETDFRDMRRGEKRESWQKQRRQTCCRDLFLWALGWRKPLLSQVSERTEDCCHGHLVTAALPGFGAHVSPSANVPSTVGT